MRIIVGFAAGGGSDITARLIGQWLAERLGQQFIIENRPGAASNIATETVVRAPADGYTLLLVTNPNVINATLYDKLNYNLIRDIAPVASIDRVPNVMEVHPSVPTRTVPEFIAYAKANPATPPELIDKLNKEINAGLADPTIKARFAELGGTVLPGSHADFRKLIADETEKWAKVIRTAQIKAE